MENRVSRLEERMDKVEDKLEKHSIEQAETRVYVKEIYKKLDDLNTRFATLSSAKQNDSDDKNNDRWAKIVERAFWAIVTIVGYFVGKGGLS
jgi:uncharacterized coiled-coil protein SlyX